MTALRLRPAGATWEAVAGSHIVHSLGGPHLDVVLAGPAAIRAHVVLPARAPGCALALTLTCAALSRPDLGALAFRSGSWSMARDLVADDVEAELEKIGGPALARLSIEPPRRVALAILGRSS